MLNQILKDKELLRLIKKSRVFVFFLIAFFIISIVLTIKENRLYQNELCFSSSCLKFFFDKMDGLILIIQGLGWLMTTFVTIFGVIIALFTYVSSVKTSKLTNHISHLNMFRDFTNSEILKRSEISPNKINIFKWYNVIFKESKNGDFIVSDEYTLILLEINNLISETNEHVSSPDKDYKYQVHQRKMIVIFEKIGIFLSRGPKNKFIEVEAQIFYFVDVINMTFSNLDIELSKIEKKYS